MQRYYFFTALYSWTSNKTVEALVVVHLKNSNGLSMVLVILHIDNVNLDSIRYQNKLRFIKWDFVN